MCSLSLLMMRGEESAPRSGIQECRSGIRNYVNIPPAAEMALPTINNQREDSSLGVTTRKFKTTRSGLHIPPVIDNQRKANLWM